MEHLRGYDVQHPNIDIPLQMLLYLCFVEVLTPDLLLLS